MPTSWCWLLLSKSRPHVANRRTKLKTRTSDFVQNCINIECRKKTKFKMFQLYFWTCSAWVGSPTQSYVDCIPSMHWSQRFRTTSSLLTLMCGSSVPHPSKLRPMLRIVHVSSFLYSLTLLVYSYWKHSTCKPAAVAYLRSPHFSSKLRTCVWVCWVFKSCRDTLTHSNFHALSLSLSLSLWQMTLVTSVDFGPPFHANNWCMCPTCPFASSTCACELHFQ